MKGKKCLGVHKGFTCLCIVPFDLLGPASPRRLCHDILKVYMRCIDSPNHDIFAYLRISFFFFLNSKEGELLIPQRKSFFHEVELEILIDFLLNRP